jgi:hypothetical protein
MSSFRLVFVYGVTLGLTALLFALSACGGGGGSAPASVGTPSYTLTAAALNPASITSGQAASSTITVTPANGYAGSVQLSCSAITGGTPAPSCSFSPSAVTISNATAGSAVLTVRLPRAAHPGAAIAVSVTGSDGSNNWLPATALRH